jgi:large subunit ribosomal protein L15
MKLHDLKPAPGSRRPRTRVGRGIAAGQGKTAGRGTKGQRARAGGSIPPWFEGGQTPIHVRVPKLRGFKNRFKIEYAVVNVGQISAYAEAGRFGVEAEQPKSTKGKASDQPVVTVNAEVLANAGLIRGDEKPLKVLGQGDVSHKLFVAAQAFSASARKKIEDAGGFVQVLAEPEQAEQPKQTEQAEQAAQPELVQHADAPEAVQQAEAPDAVQTADSNVAADAKPARKTKASAKADEHSETTQAAAAEKSVAKPRRRATKSDETD